MATVVVYHIPGNGRSKLIADAMAAGVGRFGHKVKRQDTDNYRGAEGDVAVFYGFITPLQRAMQEYRQRGGAVYVDLGYWGREGQTGYHKVSVNDRHPTAYFRKRSHDASRARRLGVETKPWRKGGEHILLAGMGPKAAWVEGLPANEWERSAIETIRAATDRPILYRPKPSDRNARPLPGARYSDPKTQSLDEALNSAFAVCTHHSNVGVDALVAGVPVFTVEGVAKPFAGTFYEAPVYSDGREQWINDVSWTQFNVAEMHSGVAWSHLKDEGLVP